MRVGLIADIHGNLTALEAVLADLASSRVDRLVCLGDVAALGPQPAGVVALLRRLGVPTVMGNTDDWIVAGVVPGPRPAGPDPVTELTRWAREQLSAADRAYLAALPPTLDVELAPGRRLRCFHGSPCSHEDVIAAGTPEVELDAMDLDPAAAVLAGGHTHVQLVRRRGAAWLLNPGSVGLPGVGPDSPYLASPEPAAAAEYAIVGLREGRLSVELRHLPLDVDDLLRVARRTAMPHRAWWEARWRRPQEPWASSCIASG